MKQIINNVKTILESVESMRYETLKVNIEDYLLKSQGVLIDIQNRKSEIDKKQLSLKEELINYKNDLRFHDYFLWGIFGDYKKKTRIITTQKELEQLIINSNEIKKYTSDFFIEKIYDKEMYILERIFILKDEEYTKLCNRFKKIDTYITNLEEIICYADNAISDIKSAIKTEALDMISNSKLVALATNSDTEDASNSILKLQNKCKLFNSSFVSDVEANNQFNFMADIFSNSKTLKFIGSYDVIDSLQNALDEILSLKHTIENKVVKAKEKRKQFFNEKKDYINTKTVTKDLAKKYLKLPNK